MNSATENILLYLSKKTLTRYRSLYFVWFFISQLLVSCGFESDVEGAKTYTDSIKHIPTHVETSGTLVALIDNSMSSYYVYKGQPRGFEFELLSWFCKDHDLELDVKIVHFESVIDSLLAGVGDIAAANLTVNRERSERVHFTPHLIRNQQVLVQRYPPNYNRMSRREKASALVHNALDLDGKVVHVHAESAFYQRLQNIAEENAIDILIHPVEKDVSPDELARMVSLGEINYTVFDENTARLHSRLYPNLHVETPINIAQSIAWATRKNSDSLNVLLDNWIEKNRNSNKFAVIYKKYFKPSRSMVSTMQSPFNLAVGGEISPYDQFFKLYGEQFDIDWRLLAAVAYQESKFNPLAESPFGARGLMQLMPNTANRFGVSFENIHDPKANIMAATRFLRHLFDYWTEKLGEESTEIYAFVLASYNAGLGHVIDARNLAEKHGFDDRVWKDNVETMLLKKSMPKYYTDEVVKHGYVRGHEPVRYVSSVMSFYSQYQMLLGVDVNA